MGFGVYKDLKLIYILGCIFGIPVCAVILALIGFREINLIISLIAFIFILAVVLNMIALKRIDKLMEKYNNCQITEYIEAYEELLGRSNKHNDAIALNLSSGYINSGQFDRAEYLLSTIKFGNKNGAVSINNRAVYLNNLCALYRALGNRELAQKYFEELQQLLYDSKIKSPYDVVVAHLCCTQKINMEMLTASPEMRLEYCEILLTTANMMLKKVSVEYEFGRAYEDLGNIEKAKEHYNYAATNGGSSIYCKKANERLKELNKE